MFGDLSASRPTRSFRRGEWTGVIGASVFHVGLLLLGGSQVVERDQVPPSDTSILVFPTVTGPAPSGADPPSGSAAASFEAPAPVDWRPVMVPDIHLAPDLGTIDLGADFGDVFGPRSPAAPGVFSLSAATETGNVVRESAPDAPLGILRAPKPRYPEWLRRAGVAGAVTVEFVVDTSGRVETQSIRIISADRSEFVESVVQALDRAKFSPGRVRGRPTRVAVRQDFRFRIHR